LKIVEHESGFNPDAANTDTTASGLGQTMNGTFKQFGPHGANIFDLDSNAEATVRYYQHCLNIAAKKGLTGEKLDSGTYACYHDGPENFKNGKDKGGADTYKNVINKLSGKPKVSLIDPFLGVPGSPFGHAMDALGVKSDDVQLTPAMDYGNTMPEFFNMIDKGTSEKIGSCVMTPGGCEMTAGDKKVVLYQLSDSDVSLESCAKNDEGDFEFLGQSRIGANDGITVRRPFMG
jgi:hypothetical protein